MVDRGLVAPILYRRTLSRVAVYAVIMGAYTLLPIWKENSQYNTIGDVPTEIHAALTLVLGWLLVFRTNTAYSRWWEARTLWGGLVNASRNLAVKCSHLVSVPEEELVLVQRDVIAFAYALKDHLRSGATLQHVPGWDGTQETPDHVPLFLVNQRYIALSRWMREYDLTGEEMLAIDRDLAKFMDICGGCERIRKTRIVRSYRTFARQCVLLFLVTLPWGIVESFGWWTFPLTVIVSYFMMGLEAVAEDVEEPFGHDDDDLDLDGLCRTIQVSVEEAMLPIRA